MPTPTRGPRLGGSPQHQRLILSNLATQLFEHGRITTTVTKAKRLRPLAERLITKARRGDLHARRQVARVVRDKDVAQVLFAEIGPRYATRPGGYTRITRIGVRKGDNAPLAVIELVEDEAGGGGGRTQAAPSRRRARRPAEPAAAEQAPAATEPVAEQVPAASEPEAEAQPAAETEEGAEPDAEAASEPAAEEQVAEEERASDAVPAEEETK